MTDYYCDYYYFGYHFYYRIIDIPPSISLMLYLAKRRPWRMTRNALPVLIQTDMELGLQIL